MFDIGKSSGDLESYFDGDTGSNVSFSAVHSKVNRRKYMIFFFNTNKRQT